MKRLSEHRKKQLAFLIADLLSAEVVWIAFLLFRWLVYEGLVFGVEEVLIPAFSFYPPLIIYPLACVCIYYLSGYYMRPAHKSIGSEVMSTFFSSFVIVMGAFFIIIIDDDVDSYQRYYISLMVLFSLQFVIALVPRIVLNIWFNRHQKERVFYLTADTDEQMTALKQQMPIDRIHIDLSNSNQTELYELIAKVYPLNTAISLPASTFDILSGAAKIKNLEEKPLIVITDHTMADWELAIKRTFDIVASLLGLICLSPAYLTIAAIVWATTKGPAIYKQERIGLSGKTFMIYKFRTMYINAEESVPQLSNINDSRITPIGRFLRKYRLDELPQLYNVLKGDMSIVGPRPEREYFIDQIMKQAPYYCLLYRIRPGLTSWGPIKVGYTDTLKKMIERLNYDIAYMENMSLLLDVKIMFYTLKVLFNGEGQ